jgi:hypothetical protein
VAPAAHRSGPIKGPLEQVPPRSRAHASLERVPPRSRANSSLERVPPRSRAHASLERVPPRSRANSSLERVPPRSRAPPSSGFRLARGLTSASLEGSPPPRSRLPRKRTYSRTRVRAFNALTQQSRAITRLGITPRRCTTNSLGETHPRHCGGLCNMANVSSVTMCRPLPYG